MKNKEEMQAGVITRDGFLGSDQRTPAEIIRADGETVKKLGLTHQAIADRMNFFREEGKRALDGFVKVKPHFEILCDMARGFLPCPFGEPGIPACNLSGAGSIAGRHRKTIVTVRNLNLRKEIIFSDLNIHLIAAHGFYEGKGSPFRLEPEMLAQVLEIGGR